LLPSLCAICRTWPAEPICRDCAGHFAQAKTRCPGCARPWSLTGGRCGHCLRDDNPLSGCIAALDYAYPWASLIVDFKFNRHPGWAGPLAALLARGEGVQALLGRCDCLIPVPLSPERLRERGFNQSLELARQVAPARLDSRTLLRVRHTTAQSGLDRAARLLAMNGAFAVDPLRAARLRGRTVVLMDDVMTSGATLFSAARSLLCAGAAEVHGLVLARTPD